MTIHKVMLPKDYAIKAVRDRWNGYPVEVDTSMADELGQVTCTFLDGPDKERAIWLHPLWLMEPALTPLEPDTKGEW
jgi:hypothetical protein